MSEPNPTALSLDRLTLSQFRNFAQLVWRPSAKISAIFGPNGSGKTNLLEAVSLLVPGRGLRAARIADLPRNGATVWGVNGRFRTPSGEAEVGTGSAEEGSYDRRTFRLDGTSVRKTSVVADRIAAVWLTPQMDRLFQEGTMGRRRFLDRLVFAFEPGHARDLSAFETAMTQRNRLLADQAKSGRSDPDWLTALEDSVARHTVSATANRLATVKRLNATRMTGALSHFPAALMTLLCPVGERLEREPALAVEDWVRAELAISRRDDAARGSASVGAHRTDMLLSDAASGLAAAKASTGQQKALLIGVVLAHAGLLQDGRGFAPLLLLDEPTVHLDRNRREALFAALAGVSAQVLLTGTDREMFLPLRSFAEGLKIERDNLQPDPDFRSL